MLQALTLVLSLLPVAFSLCASGPEWPPPQFTTLRAAREALPHQAASPSGEAGPVAEASSSALAPQPFASSAPVAAGLAADAPPATLAAKRDALAHQGHIPASAVSDALAGGSSVAPSEFTPRGSSAALHREGPAANDPGTGAPPAGLAPERPAPAHQVFAPAADLLSGPIAAAASQVPPGPVVAGPAAPEQRPLTLQQAVALALQQNPDYLLAKLDEQKARQGVREADIPFITKINLGSGLAKGNGFPLSIEGAAPSVMQIYASRYIYNRAQSYRVKEAGEMANAAVHSTQAKSDEIAYRVAAAYLDFERATRALGSAKTQVETLTRMQGLMEERVRAGREIPLETSRARVEVARARSQLQTLQMNVDLLEETLRDDLGLGDGARIVPVETTLPSQLTLPQNEDDAIADALGNSEEIKRLQSVLQAKRYALTAEKSARYPHVDLVAQYALLAQYNNYQDYFKTFQRHNGQLGASIQMPILNGGAIAIRVAEVQTEISQTNLRLASARASIALETRRLFYGVRQADSARSLARMELDLAREALSVSLARFDEGRIPFSEIEQARITEAQKWEAFYDARTAADKARLNLLRQTGELVAALR